MCYSRARVEACPHVYALAPKSKAHPLGYLTITLGTLGKKNTNVTELAHRLILLSIHGPPPDEATNIAMHTCHNPGCLNPHHLVWGTSLDNSRKGVAATARYHQLMIAQGRPYAGPPPT